MSMTAHSQRGVALLTILLLVVSITVVAGAMLASQKIAIRRSGLLLIKINYYKTLTPVSNWR